MLRYTTDRARPGFVTFYDIRRGNGAGLFLQPRNPHGAERSKEFCYQWLYLHYWCLLHCRT